MGNIVQKLYVLRDRRWRLLPGAPRARTVAWGLVVVTVTGLILLSLGLESYDGVEVRGELRATDQEIEEGYFAVGGETMIVVKPSSQLHHWLRGHVGQRVLVTLQPEPTE